MTSEIALHGVLSPPELGPNWRDPASVGPTERGEMGCPLNPGNGTLVPASQTPGQKNTATQIEGGHLSRCAVENGGSHAAGEDMRLTPGLLYCTKRSIRIESTDRILRTQVSQVSFHE